MTEPSGDVAAGAAARADAVSARPAWKRNLRVLSLSQFLAVSGMSIVLPFMPFFLRELGMTDRAAVERWSGLVFSGPFLAAGLLAPVWGYLGDRYGHRLMVVRAIWSLALVNLLMVFVQTPLQLWILRLLQGMVTGFIPAALAITSASTPAAHLPAAMANLQATASAGRLVGPSVGGLLAGFLPFRQIFLIVAAIITVGAILVLRYLEEPPRAALPPHSSPLATLRFAWGDGPIRLGLMGLLAAMAAHSMVMPVFPLYVEDLVGTGGNAPLWTGIGFGVVAAFTMLGASAVGPIAKRVGLKVILTSGLAITAAGLLAHPFARDLPAMLGARALLGIGVAGVQPALYAMISRRAPRGVGGGIQGYASSAAIFGFFVGPFLGGWLANHVGVGGVFHLAAALAAACALFAAIVAKRRGTGREIPPISDPLPR